MNKAKPKMVSMMQQELGALSLAEACRYFENCLDTFQLDPGITFSFIERVLSEKPQDYTPDTRSLLEVAIKAAVNLASLDPDTLRLALMSGIAPQAEPVIKVLEATHVEPEVFDEIRNLPLRSFAAEIRQICERILLRHPMAFRYADLLLHVDLFEARPPADVLSRMKCPRMLASLWTKRLFDHHATMGDDVRAWTLWEALPEQLDDPFTLSRAAEMLRRRGDLKSAIGLYRRALSLAPRQRPYDLRIRELESPFRPDASLVDNKRVAICLYSYNKAGVLRDTLESLSQSEIGPARVTVLLNGCTDDSLAAVESMRPAFPNNPFEIISLPVNVGAPAARNWLLSLPSTRECEYVAFLDDDVYVQQDWLAHLLTVAETDPRIGNVGCKVVFPGEYRLLQYLYRHISIANERFIHTSPPVPYLQYDIGLYDVIRETRVVMGCQHLLRVRSLEDAPWFDIRYSPSQIDDTDHDLQLCLAGWKVWYCGTVTCVHRQDSGTSLKSKLNHAAQGSIMGNDLKFFYKWLDNLDKMRALDALNLRNERT